MARMLLLAEEIKTTISMDSIIHSSYLGELDEGKYVIAVVSLLGEETAYSLRTDILERGEVQTTLDVTLQKTHTIMCSGVARNDTVSFQGSINFYRSSNRPEFEVYELEVESTEIWCLDGGCVFGVIYSISKSNAAELADPS